MFIEVTVESSNLILNDYHFFSFYLVLSKPVSIADPAALGFIISPWSLLLMPSGSVSFTDENISSQDLRAFTAPEVLQNHSLTSLSDVEKVNIKSSLLLFILIEVGQVQTMGYPIQSVGKSSRFKKIICSKIYIIQENILTWEKYFKMLIIISSYLQVVFNVCYL